MTSDCEVTGLKLIIRFLVALTLIAMMVSTVNAQPPTLLWSDEVETLDIALSKDGQYVVIAAYDPVEVSSQVQFYGRSSKIPIWTWSPTAGNIHSVAISADGDCVVAGTTRLGPNGEVYFWKNARTLTGTPDPSWSSESLGFVYRRCLDISDDGDHVVAAGFTGSSADVFYWANAKGLQGDGKPSTWSCGFNNIYSVDLSSDGDYVAAGVATSGSLLFGVAYWKNARTLTGDPQAPAWTSTKSDSPVVDVAVSDDGDYVAAAADLDTVYYWAGAKSLSGDPDPTWKSGLGVHFTSLDMSSNGGSVIAGGVTISTPNIAVPPEANPDLIETSEVYFWGGARGLTGTPDPSWTYTITGIVFDVAINTVGDYMAAVTAVLNPEPSKVYFFDIRGNLLWSYELDNPGWDVSISSTGDTLAVGTASISTGYLFDTGYSTIKPVGGYVVSINKLSILAPYLALAGLVAVLSTVAVVRKRSRA